MSWFYIFSDGIVPFEIFPTINTSIEIVEGSGVTVVKSTTIYDANQVVAPEVSTEISAGS